MIGRCLGEPSGPLIRNGQVVQNYSALHTSSSARPSAWLLLIQEGQNAVPVRRFKVEQALALQLHLLICANSLLV